MRDDRGKIVTVRWADDSAFNDADDETQLLLERMQKVGTSRVTDRWDWKYVLVILIHIGVFLFAIVVFNKLGVGGLGTQLLATLVTSVSFLIFSRGLGYDGAHRAVPIAIAHGRCPACLYPLPAAAEADGCVLCPECGSAWSPENHHAS